MENAAWRYLRWFYDQMDRVYVPSRVSGSAHREGIRPGEADADFDGRGKRRSRLKTDARRRFSPFTAPTSDRVRVDEYC